MNSTISLLILNALAKHHTLTLPQLLQQNNQGLELVERDIELAIVYLKENKLITITSDQPPAYTITSKGIGMDQRIQLDF